MDLAFGWCLFESIVSGQSGGAVRGATSVPILDQGGLRSRKRIIPDAHAQSQEAIRAYQTAQAEKKAAKTTNLILAYLEGRESATPAEIAKALSRRHNTIIQACRRMAQAGSVIALDGAYSLADDQPKPNKKERTGKLYTYRICHRREPLHLSIDMNAVWGVKANRYPADPHERAGAY